MPSLLDLPNELLYEIIAFVARWPYATTHGTRHRPVRQQSRSVICYPEPKLTYPCGLNLLLSNRRLQSEMHLYYANNSPSFELDVAVVDGNWIWPSWKCIPPRACTGTHAKLIINIIPCCTDDQRQSKGPGVAGNEEAMAEVLRLTGQFLLQGPHNIASDRSSNSNRDEPPLHFQTLIFKVDTVRQLNGKPCFSQSEVPFRKIEDMKHLDFDLLYPSGDEACRLQFESWIAIMPILCRRAIGAVIYERVDEIVFMINGHNVHEMHIARDVKNKRQRQLAEYAELQIQQNTGAFA